MFGKCKRVIAPLKIAPTTMTTAPLLVNLSLEFLSAFPYQDQGDSVDRSSGRTRVQERNFDYICPFACRRV